MNVVVTGGAGFIGANLVHALADDEAVDGVTVIDDLSTGARANLARPGAPLPPKTRLVEASILDADALADAVEGADAIVHLAARPSVPRSIADPLATHEANATGTLRVLMAARDTGGAHTILASSSSVYGANPTLPKDESLRPEPMSPYAASKLAAESYMSAFAECFDLPVLAFRFFNVFGPLQAAGHAYAAVVPKFIDAAMRGEPLPVEGDGTQTRDFTAVASVVAVIRDAVVRRVADRQPVNLAFGTRHSLNDAIDLLSTRLGRQLETRSLPARIGDVKHSQADSTRLRSLFPNIEPVPFAEGIDATVSWFESGHLTSS